MWVSVGELKSRRVTEARDEGISVLVSVARRRWIDRTDSWRAFLFDIGMLCLSFCFPPRTSLSAWAFAGQNENRSH